LPSEKN